MEDLVQITKWSDLDKIISTTGEELWYIEWLEKELEKMTLDGRIGEIRRNKNGKVALFAENLVLPNKKRWEEIYRNGRPPRPNRAG